MLTDDQTMLLNYIAKCVIGCVVMFAVGQALPLVDISWVLISMLLVLSPDGKEAVALTVIRVKANLVASVVTILLLLVVPYAMLAITLAIVVTILCCYALNLMAGSRPALAAVIIIAMHPPGEYLWSTAVARVVSVVAGCALAMLLTFLFHRTLILKHLLRSDQLSE